MKIEIMNTIETQSPIIDSSFSILKETISQSTQVLGSLNAGIAIKLADKVENAKYTNGKIKSKSIPIWLHLLVLSISSQVTIGLAKVFDFEILTHGTSFTNCYGILKNGADPSKSGSEIGSTNFYLSGDSNISFMKNANNPMQLLRLFRILIP